MPHRNLTPETVFKPLDTAQTETVVALEGPPPTSCEQDQYKKLIAAELMRKGMPLAHLADRLRLPRPRLHKILKRTSPLSEELRDRIFGELGIDAVRAIISIALLHDYRTYVGQAAFLTAESMKSFYLEVMTCRRGSIEVDLRPAIIHEAARRAYDLLLQHQERVMMNDQTLQA